MIFDIFLNNLKSQMLKHGIKTQTALANGIGVDQRTVNKWFTGKVKGIPDGDHLQKICDFFGVPLSVLLSEQPKGIIKFKQHKGPDPILPEIVSKVEYIVANGSDDDKSLLLGHISRIYLSVANKDHYSAPRDYGQLKAADRPKKKYNSQDEEGK